MVSKRRNDDRDFRRKAPRRTPKFRILVVCEGEVTEREYLQQFQHDVRNNRVHVEVPDAPGVPVTVVSTATRLRQEADAQAERLHDDNLRFDSAWAVFDIDEHPNLEEARQLAQAANIELAISNPCFELWALLHFEDQRSHIDRKAVVSRLREHCPRYEKQLPYDKLRGKYVEALERAKSLWDEAEHHSRRGRNPTTGIFNLTELIRTK